MNNEIMVSVLCIAYNHEKYIRQCLESLLMQKTNFNYEIIVHDDASTDNTANIIREYEKKYPEVVKPIYQSENQYSKGVQIGATYITPMIRGKYVAHCEGDDFWMDPYKLQKQFDIMEKNPDCSICTHRVMDVTESGENTGKFHPNFELKETKMNLGEYLKMTTIHDSYPFQTTSYFIRADVKKEYAFNTPVFVKEFGVGDVPTVLYALTKGNLYYLDETMSCYRRFSQGSWSSNYDNGKTGIMFTKKFLKGFETFNDYTNKKYDVYLSGICEKHKFFISLASWDGKTCLNKKYRKYYNECLGKREKLKVIIFFLFPFLKQIAKRKNGIL